MTEQIAELRIHADDEAKIGVNYTVSEAIGSNGWHVYNATRPMPYMWHDAFDRLQIGYAWERHYWSGWFFVCVDPDGVIKPEGIRIEDRLQQLGARRVVFMNDDTIIETVKAYVRVNHHDIDFDGDIMTDPDALSFIARQLELPALRRERDT
jgi:hypothetical protein